MTAADVFELSGNLARILCMVCAVVLSCIAFYRDANGEELKATNLIAFACFFAIMAK
jgi:uncharacterized membrane protein